MSWTPQNESGTLAALHRTGDVWRVVVAERTNGRLRLVDSRSFSRPEWGRIEGWLEECQVARTICVLPASNVVCRTTALPDAGQEELQAALELQAETYLEDVAPAHRRGMAVLDAAPGEANRAGLLLAWPENAEAPDPPVSRDVTWAPDAAGLAAIIDGARFDKPVMWVDRNDGSIALAVTHSGGVVYRASSEPADDPHEWRDAIRRFLVETALNVGHSEEYIATIAETAEAWLDRVDATRGKLCAEEAVFEAAAQRLEGSKSEASWWAEFGVAAGVLLATLDQLDPLTRLRDEAPIETPSTFERITGRLGSPRAATVAVVMALIVIGLGPLIFAGVRLQLLKWKVGDLETFRQRQDRKEVRLAMYEELAANTWPMAKLMADLVNCAPEELTVKSLILDEDSEEFDVRGTAETSDAVIAMTRNLTETGIFIDVVQSHSDRDQRSSKFEFTITGSVRDPYRRAQYENDFADNPLGRRLYGERFQRVTHRTLPPPEEEDDEAPAEEHAEDPDGEAVAGAGSGDNRDEFGARTGPRIRRPPNIPSQAQGGGGASQPKLPPMLSSEEIGEMSHSELMNAMARIGNLRRNTPGLTDEQRKQLSEQFDLMMKHLPNAKRD